MSTGGKMEYLRESADSFLCGLVLGLGVSIFISICYLVVDTYDRTLEVERLNQQYEQRLSKERTNYKVGRWRTLMTKMRLRILITTIALVLASVTCVYLNTRAERPYGDSRSD